MEKIFSPDNRGTVPATEILDALKRGESIRIEHATISGVLSCHKIDTRERLHVSHCTFQDKISVTDCVLGDHDGTLLLNCEFSDRVDLKSTLIDGPFNLTGSVFKFILSLDSVNVNGQFLLLDANIVYFNCVKLVAQDLHVSGIDKEHGIIGLSKN